MKKTRIRKLSLSKETVRVLSGETLRNVAAGDSGGSDTGSALCPSDPRASYCDSCVGKGGSCTSVFTMP